jgi:hypothetical protein
METSAEEVRGNSMEIQTPALGRKPVSKEIKFSKIGMPH